MKSGRGSFVGYLRRIFVLLILIPVIVLGIIIFFSAYRFTKTQAEQSLSNVIEQSQIDLKNRFATCEYSLRYLASNYTLQEYLKMDMTKYKEVLNKSKTISPLLSNTTLSNPYCRLINVYSIQEDVLPVSTVTSDASVREQEWYRELMRDQEYLWQFEDHKLFTARRITTAYPKKVIGAVYMEIEPRIFADSQKLFSDLPVYIHVDWKNDTLFSFKNTTEEHYRVFYQDQLADTDWTITYEISAAYFAIQLRELIIPIIIVIVILVITWIGFRVMSGILTRDLKKLVVEVNEIQLGNLDVCVEDSNFQEVNLLASTIEDMLSRIKKLIQQVYVTEKERQALELDLLKSKINPHFLYNNLSAINWLAIDCDEPQISEITSELANFYRTALNKSKASDKLRVEVSNIKSYIRLQEIAHENSFDVEYDIPEELMEIMVPGFILQPLVENALEHGIDMLRGERGRIRITARKNEQSLIITISDNGKELFARIGSHELQQDQFGYGTTNVHKRIQLLCTSESGLRIFATPEGTISQITLCCESFYSG